MILFAKWSESIQIDQLRSNLVWLVEMKIKQDAVENSVGEGRVPTNLYQCIDPVANDPDVFFRYARKGKGFLTGSPNDF